MPDVNLRRFLHSVRNKPNGVLLLSIILVGLIARAPTSVYAPVAAYLEPHFGVDHATFGWLSGIPVFCFALFTPLASRFIAKRGLDDAFLTGIIITTLGVALRLVDNFLVLFIATIIIGAGIAFMNTTVPLMAARSFPKKFAIVTGTYSSFCNLGVVFAFSFTAPFADIIGWQLSMFMWFFMCVLNILVFVIYIFRRKRGKSRKQFRVDGEDWSQIKKLRQISKKATEFDAESYVQPAGVSETVEEARNSRQIHRQAFTYGICLLFICQCVAYFTFAAWLPKILQDTLNMDASTAGIASSMFPLMGIFGSIAVTPFLKRVGVLPSFIGIALGWLMLPLGLLFLPELWAVWCAAAGICQAANYVTMFDAIKKWSKTSEETRKLSSATQVSAYICAGISPSLFGAIHDATLQWPIVISLLGVTLFIMLLSGFLTYRTIKEGRG
ncbi:MAG: MFS transporter [Candidatus Ancillula sp.]|jgi:CP family cyanate transporter-like MFS transporter|nr:MFS transporter [Candidatus Ancillula sp.]